MKCTGDEWDHCRVEKMGCSGCYYDKDTLEESINNLKKLVELRKNKCGKIKFDSCICGTKDLEIVLQALERYKRLAEMNLKNSEEFKNNMCEHRCPLKSELQALKEEYRQYREFICVTGGKDIDDITATQYVSIQREGYLRGRKDEQKKAMQFMQENVIFKKKIENKIEYLEIRKAECDDIESKVRLDVKINAYVNVK